MVLLYPPGLTCNDNIVLRAIKLASGCSHELPLGVVVASNETISKELNSSSVVYLGGSVGRQLTLSSTLP